MECFAQFLPPAGIEMYFYDQLGCGFSDHPDDERLWNLERYVDEVYRYIGGGFTTAVNARSPPGSLDVTSATRSDTLATDKAARKLGTTATTVRVRPRAANASSTGPLP